MAFHAAIFSLWMGYCYTINAHPRVDTLLEGRSYRSRAWIELAGCVLLALPYVTLVAYFSLDSWPVRVLSTSSPTALWVSLTAGSSRASLPPASGWSCWAS